MIGTLKSYWARRKINQDKRKKLKRIYFNDEERKRIKSLITPQLPSSELWLKIDGLLFPKPGHIFRIKRGSRYTLVAPDDLVFLKALNITKETFLGSQGVLEAVILRLDSEGKIADTNPVQVRMNDLEPVDNEKDIMENWWKVSPAEEQNLFYDGDVVELTENITITAQAENEAAAITLPKGLKGVIDAPKIRRGANLNEINSHYQQKIRLETVAEIGLWWIKNGIEVDRFWANYFIIPRAEGYLYDVYFPSENGTFQFTQSKFKKRSFDKEAFNKVVMDEKTRKRILSLVFSHQETLQKWGINSGFKKDKGDIFLAFGPPGGGKTMTGEALAELTERPLYIVDSRELRYGAGSFEESLKRVMEKIERWKAFAIIDEAEIVLLSRDFRMFESDIRVTAVLRNFEKLRDGILWLTTNRPIDIDFAIESRLRDQIHFPELNEEKRKKVWQITLPKEMPVKEFDAHLNELAKFPLNGREIKKAIINAAKTASYNGLDYVPVEYLIDAAKNIQESKEAMKKAKEESLRNNPQPFIR